ncbi:MAG TPA: septum formation initiator family protein [Candidatus Pygmaiobacter gallistercoris]|nr:septum formation initiator family protein [Candidatus Pygmaiobacter gallistercoris]
MRRRREKRVKFSAFLMRIGAAALIVYLAVTLIVSQVDIMVKRQQLDSLTADLSRQVEENTELQRLYSAGESEEYIERIARDRLGYVAPDERIYIDMSGE